MLQKKCRRVKKKTTKQERERFCFVLQISAHKESLAQSQKKKWCRLNIKYSSHSCLLINGKFFSASISGKTYQCLLRYQLSQSSTNWSTCSTVIRNCGRSVLNAALLTLLETFELICLHFICLVFVYFYGRRENRHCSTAC